MQTSIFLIITAIFMIATRGQSELVHLPDFTLVALLIAGTYFRQSWIVISIIIFAIGIDNYVITYQGISANCITFAYLFLPLTYYAVFWSAKFLTTLSIDKNILQNFLLILIILIIQWLIATASYYIFASNDWINFTSYIVYWIIADNSILGSLQWLGFISIIFTIFNSLKSYFLISRG